MLESINPISKRVLFDIFETAEMIGRSPKAVRRLIEKKRITPVRQDRRIFFNIKEIYRFSQIEPELEAVE